MPSIEHVIMEKPIFESKWAKLIAADEDDFRDGKRMYTMKRGRFSVPAHVNARFIQRQASVSLLTEEACVPSVLRTGECSYGTFVRFA
jgi:hypothetical protein